MDQHIFEIIWILTAAKNSGSYWSYPYFVVCLFVKLRPIRFLSYPYRRWLPDDCTLYRYLLKKRSGTPLISPPENYSSKGEGQNIISIYVWFIVFKITARIKLRQCKKFFKKLCGWARVIEKKITDFGSLDGFKFLAEMNSSRSNDVTLSVRLYVRNKPFCS